MRIGFEHAAIHEGPGVALVGIAEHVFHVACALAGKLPFQTGGEPGPAASPQARELDLLDDLLRGHIPQGLGRPEIPVPGDVLVDHLGIDHSLVAHDPEHLVGKKGNLIHFRDGFLGGRLHVK